MSYPLQILAQRDDGDGGWVKFVFGAIFFIIWIVSALGTWLNKRHEEERRRRLREQLDRGGAAPPPVPMPAPAPARANQPAPPPRAPKRFPQRAPKPPRVPAHRARGVPVPPPPVPALRDVTESTTQPITATEISAARKGTAQAPGATAPTIARWLRPETLRRQFILTEILQPPLALRESRDGM